MALTNQQFDLLRKQLDGLKERSPFYAENSRMSTSTTSKRKAISRRFPLPRKPTYAPPIRWD